MPKKNTIFEPYIRLSPVGTGFYTEQEMQTLTKQEEVKFIDTARNEFRKLCSISNAQTRRTQDEKGFISKTFFTQFYEKQMSEDICARLLADHCTIFSSGFREYRTDHAAYHNIRKMQIIAQSKAHPLYWDEALNNVSEELHSKYEELFGQLENTAQKSFVTLSELLGKWIDMATSEISEPDLDLLRNLLQGDEQSKIPKFMENHHYLIGDTECATLLDHYFEDPQRVLLIYKAVVVTVFPEFQRRLYKILKKRFSVQLGTLNDSEENISIVIVNFYMSERSCRLEKEAAGHYRTDYLRKDLLSCKQYIDRRKALQYLLEECHTWVEFTNFPEGALPAGSIYSDEELPCKIKSQMADAIVKATEKYFREAGNRHIEIKRANCRSVISQLLRLHNTFAVFPFCYLAVCCIGGGRMFSSTYTLDSEAYKPLLNGDYRDKRLAKKKRLAIIRLLDELNNACELTREQQQYNWKYFLQTFGAKIMSSDEELLWHGILNEPISPQKESSLKLPPIELSLLCKEYLQICFPIQPENLYCYNNCSALHMGKYSLFLRQHAQTIDDS